MGYHRPLSFGESTSIDNVDPCILDDCKKYCLDWYLNPKAGDEIVKILRSIQGNPEAEVTIYRGSPSKDLNCGDWVSLSKEYAKKFAGISLYAAPGAKVHTFVARAKDISFCVRSIFENGYWGYDTCETE